MFLLHHKKDTSPHIFGEQPSKNLKSSGLPPQIKAKGRVVTSRLCSFLIWNLWNLHTANLTCFCGEKQCASHALCHGDRLRQFKINQETNTGLYVCMYIFFMQFM